MNLRLTTQFKKGERIILKRAIKAQLESLIRIKNGETASDVIADCKELGIEPSDLYHEVDHDILVYKEVYNNLSDVFVILQESHLRMIKHFITNLKFERHLHKDKTQVWHKMQIRDYSMTHFNSN